MSDSDDNSGLSHTGDAPETGGGGKRQWFVTTSWTNLMAAKEGDDTQAREALEQLCASYWYPLYAYVRRLGNNAQDSEDITQGFFHSLLEKNFLSAIDRRKGKFRSFLLASLNHFIANRWDHMRAAKRGGGRALASLDEKTAEDRYKHEPATTETPEKMYEFQWATTVMERAMSNLEAECAGSGKSDQFVHLKPYVAAEAVSGDYKSVADQLNMTDGAVAVAVHRLRQRYGELVRNEVARTVGSEEEIDAEMRHLRDTLAEMSY